MKRVRQRDGIYRIEMVVLLTRRSGGLENIMRERDGDGVGYIYRERER